MQLHFQAYGHSGRGAPLIILHGLFGSLENWHSVSRALADRFYVLAVDQRNHGQSPHSPDMDYPLMAEDLREFMDGQGLARAHVLGHSMGGKTAMEFALAHPARLEKLIVVDISPRAYAPQHQQVIEALQALDLAAFRHRHELEAALAPAIPNQAVRRFLIKNVAREPQGTFRWRMNLDGIARNYAHLGEALLTGRACDRPALFIRGSKSHHLPVEDTGLIRLLFPRAVWETIAGAGHWVHTAAPAAFLRAVIEFAAAGTEPAVKSEIRGSKSEGNPKS